MVELTPVVVMSFDVHLQHFSAGVSAPIDRLLSPQRSVASATSGRMTSVSRRRPVARIGRTVQVPAGVHVR
jgi:hypothetical protein